MPVETHFITYDVARSAHTLDLDFLVEHGISSDRDNVTHGVTRPILLFNDQGYAYLVGAVLECRFGDYVIDE